MDRETRLIITLIEKLDTKVEKLDSKIDNIKEVQAEQGRILERNTVIVDRHEERSTKLEDWVSKIHAAFVKLEDEVSDVIKANHLVTSHIKKINNFIAPFKALPKIIGFILLVVSLLAGLYQLYGYVMKIKGQ